MPIFNFRTVRKLSPRRIALCAVFCCSASWTASGIGARDYAVELRAEVTFTPPRIILRWTPDPNATSYEISRKLPDSRTWHRIVNDTAVSAGSYSDSDVVAGTVYEYGILKKSVADGKPYAGFGFICAGIQVPIVENRGKVILVVDNTYAADLAQQLTRLEEDLAGDGWIVLRHDVGRADPVAKVKALITADYQADPEKVKALFLFGHVPVPYSGDLGPDGHKEHIGAWPADVYYGDMDGKYTDSTVDDPGASRPENRNVPGDGKFDQTSIPFANGRSAVELEVGRVDLADMPAFAPKTEKDLLAQYLDKDHNYRHKLLQIQPVGVINDHFGAMNGEAFSANGWRNFSVLVGPDHVAAAAWKELKPGTLWAFGAGAGGLTSAAGVASTKDYAADDYGAIFTLLFGSWFGDWDNKDNFLRAPLATSTYGLTSAWAGRPCWYLHPMGVGQTIGYCTRLTQNNLVTYPGNEGANQVHIALMGDPTLRLYPVAPPSGLTAQATAAGTDLKWNPSPDATGYGIYEADSPRGPFTRLNRDIVAQTTVHIPQNLSGKTFMVRAVKLETTHEGTWYNQSQGVFCSP